MIRLLGIAKRAGKLEIGEEPVGAAARSKQAKLILLASDAPENTCRRASSFSQSGNVALVTIPHTKDEVGFALGRSSIAMLALTDAGFAGAIGDRLTELDPTKYGEVGVQLRQKADKSLARQKEKRQHEKNLQRGKGKPWAIDPRIAKEREEKKAKKYQKVEYIDVEEDFEQSVLKKIQKEKTELDRSEKRESPPSATYKSVRKPYGKSDGYKKEGFHGERKSYGKSDGYKKEGFHGERKSYGKSDGYKKEGFHGERKPYGKSDGYKKEGFHGERKPYGKSDGYKKEGFHGERKPYGKSDGYKKEGFHGERKPYGKSDGYKKEGFHGERKPYGKSDGYKKEGFHGERKSYGKSDGYKKEGFHGERKPYAKSDGYKKDGFQGERKFYGKSDGYKDNGKSYGSSNGYKKGGHQEGSFRKTDRYKASAQGRPIKSNEVVKSVTGKKLLVKSKTSSKPPAKP